jgi:hypothetical protein
MLSNDDGRLFYTKRRGGAAAAKKGCFLQRDVAV